MTNTQKRHTDANDQNIAVSNPNSTINKKGAIAPIIKIIANGNLTSMFIRFIGVIIANGDTIIK